VAADPDRDPGHGGGAELRLGAAVDDDDHDHHDHHDHHCSPAASTDDRSYDHDDGAAGAAGDHCSSGSAYDRRGRRLRR
jgi:hypothetical protein